MLDDCVVKVALLPFCYPQARMLVLFCSGIKAGAHVHVSMEHQHSACYIKPKDSEVQM